MKLAPSNFGAEPKKVAFLGALVVVLGVVYLVNRTPAIPETAQRTAVVSAPAQANPAPARPLPPAASLTPMPPQGAQRARRGDAGVQDFKPSIKLPEGTDVSRIDPTLKLELLARLQQSELEGGTRSLFDFGPPPKPPTPAVQPIKPLAVPNGVVAATPPATPPVPVKPPVPPIPLKFYGFVTEARGATKRALFLDGEDIVVAKENDVIRNRYKVIRIGVNSAVIEDSTNKNQQTLPLVEELAG